MLTRDIHSNKETVKTALYDLHESILMAKRDKDRLLLLIVGYGSKGTAHKIKTAVIEKLEEYKNNKFIRGYLMGDKVSIFDLEYRQFPAYDKIPEMYKNRSNPGSIFIAV